MPKVVEIQRADDPRDVIHEAVQLLAEGQLVGLPTETVYIVAAHALQRPAVDALDRLQSRPGGAAATLMVRSAAEAHDYLPQVTPMIRKLTRRCWPGPVILLFSPEGEPGAPVVPTVLDRLPEKSRELVTRNEGLACRVSGHEVLSAILRLTPAPLVVAGEMGLTDPAWDSASRLLQAVGEDVSLVVDDGPTRYGQPSSVVRIQGRKSYLVRDGVVTSRTLQRLAGDVFLFVCTGNTCRSPMAESLFRKLLTEKLQCADEDLVDRGYIVMSAGLAAGPGSPPSPEAVVTLRERGIDLQQHASQPVTARLLSQADYVYTMTKQHRDVILREFPEMATQVRVLSRDGADISDPIGYGLDEYEKCASEIERHLREILAELPLPSA